MMWKSILLHKDGRLVDDDGVTGQVIIEGLAEGSYYLLLRHRNHIAVMSAAMLTLSRTSTTLYDFTTAAASCYGSGGCVELEPGYWGMWAGDINQDHIISTRDYYAWYRSNFRAESGYRIADVDLNGSVGISDYNLWRTNALINAQGSLP
jgi:hypothetical protein